MLYIVQIIHVAQFMKTIDNRVFDSNISDKCKIQKYYLELRSKLKAYYVSLLSEI